MTAAMLLIPLARAYTRGAVRELFQVAEANPPQLASWSKDAQTPQFSLAFEIARRGLYVERRLLCREMLFSTHAANELPFPIR